MRRSLASRSRGLAKQRRHAPFVSPATVVQHEYAGYVSSSTVASHVPSQVHHMWYHDGTRKQRFLIHVVRRRGAVSSARSCDRVAGEIQIEPKGDTLVDVAANPVTRAFSILQKCSTGNCGQPLTASHAPDVSQALDLSISLQRYRDQ